MSEEWLDYSEKEVNELGKMKLEKKVKTMIKSCIIHNNALKFRGGAGILV